MPIPKVQPGQPFNPRAETWNAFVETANAFQGGGASLGQRSQYDRTIPNAIMIRNDTGENLPRFGVVELTSPVISPTDNEAEFFSQLAMIGVTPTADGVSSFAVAVEPIPSGEFGYGYVYGIVPIMIGVENEDHEFAEVKEDINTNLVSASSGLVQILWKPTGAGSMPAIVQLTKGGAASDLILVKVKADGEGPTYAVYDKSLTTAEITADDPSIIDTIALATGLTPERARISGVDYISPSDGGHAIARSDGGVLYLLDVFGEKPDVEGCDQP